MSPFRAPILTLMLQEAPAAGASQAATTGQPAALGFWGATIILMIFAVLAFGLWRYLVPLWRTGQAFRDATARVRTTPTRTDIFPDHPSHLHALWAQYLKDRKGTTVQVDGTEISTVDPEDTFSEHAVLRGYNRNMALAFAGVFTGLGILGTFLGLVQGLSSISGTGAPAMMQSILGLLGGMSVAFYTSIAGITVSLLWLLTDRALYHQLQREVVGFFVAVRTAYPVESADRLLHRLLAVEQDEFGAIKQTNSILTQHGEAYTTTNELLDKQNAVLNDQNVVLEEQKAVLQTLGTDLAVAFEKALADSVSGQLVPALTAVVKSIEGISTQIGERQVDTMKKLVDGFQQSLSEQLNDQFQGLAEALHRTAEWQTRVHSELEDLLTQVRAATEGQCDVIERSNQISTLFQQGLEKLSGAHEQLGASAERVEDASRRMTEELDQTANRITAHLASTSGTLARDLERAAAMVDGMADALTASVERVDLQARALEQRIEQLDAQQETYREANEAIRSHLAEQIDGLGEQVGTLTRFWSEFRNDLASVGDQLQSSVAQFSVFTADKLREIFARFDAEMATVVQHLSGTLAEIREVNEDLPSNVERLRSTLADATTSIGEAGKAMDKLSGSMTQVDTLSTSLRGLQPLNDTIRLATAQIGQSSTQVARLDEQMKIVDRRLAAALSLANPPQASDGPGTIVTPVSS